MKRLLTVLTLTLLCAGMVFAQSEAAPAAKAEMIGEIAVKHFPAITGAVVLEKAAAYAPADGYKEGMEGMDAAFGAMMEHGFAKLMGYVQKGHQPTGPAFAVYFEDPEKVPAKDLTCKIGFPVAEGTAGEGEIVIETIPAMEAATVQYKGAYNASGDIWRAVDKWITDNGYEFAGNPMEIYLKNPGDNVPPAEYLTEIRVPVNKKE